MKIKSTIASKYLLMAAMVMFTIAGANAQNNTSVKKYRVTAFKKGNTAVQSQSNYATVIPAATLFVPNAFTPNEDGINEKFGVVGQSIGKFNMKIYNVWGEVVYETNNPNDGWDGTFKGKASPVGTYIYTINAKGLKGERLYRNGNFALVK